MTGSPRRARGVLLIAILIAAVGVGWIAAVKKESSELPVYVTGAARMAHHLEVYDPSDAKPFTYPPFFAMPFLPLVGASESVERSAWFLCNVTLLGLAVWFLRDALQRVAPISPGAVFWSLVALLSLRHLLAVFENQSHDFVILVCLCAVASAASRSREVASGAFAGLAAACKATPLLFLPAFVGQRRIAAAMGFTLVAVAATLLPDLLFPRGDGRSWVVAWIRTFSSAMTAGRPAAVGNAWDAGNFLNQNLAGTLHRLFVSAPIEREFVRNVAIVDLEDGVRRATTLIAQIAVVSIVACSAWPTRARGLDARGLAWRRIGETGAIACAMLLLSPMSSKSHFCVLLVPSAFCVAELLHGASWRRRPGVVALLAVCLASATLTTKGILGREVGNLLLAYGAVAWGTLALLCAVAILLCTSSTTCVRTPPTSPP